MYQWICFICDNKKNDPKKSHFLFFYDKAKIFPFVLQVVEVGSMEAFEM